MNGRVLPVTVFACWALGLLFLVLSGRYTVVLRPEFGLLLVLAHFVALGCMIALLVSPSARRPTAAGVLRLLIVLLPLGAVATTQDNAQLAGHAFKKRFLGLGMEQWEGQENRHQGEDTESTDGVPAERTIIELLLNASAYSGQRVSVLGKLAQDDKIGQQLGGNVAVVYRFLISCCAADARPIAVALQLPSDFALVQDSWVRVEGVFSIVELQGKRVPMLEDARIILAEPPAFPYLF